MHSTTIGMPCRGSALAKLEGGDLDGYLALFDEMRREYDETLGALIGATREHGCIRITKEFATGTRVYYLHRSSRRDGYQLTAFDEIGPVCHYDVTADDKRQDLGHVLDGPITYEWEE